MKIHKTELEGVFLIELPRYEDIRGKFIRTFNDQEFEKFLGYKPLFEECYYSHSQKNVIRGMHFQIAPHAQDKFVYVISGKIQDVVLDLRKNSRTYGSFLEFELSSENNHGLYIQKGFAHGFASLSVESITGYMLTGGYSPDHDVGVRFDSFGYDWNIDSPIVSEKDLKHPSFNETKFNF